MLPCIISWNDNRNLLKNLVFAITILGQSNTKELFQFILQFRKIDGHFVQ